MKRSEINTLIQEADDFIRSHKFHLPPFAYWSPSMWKSKGTEAREIFEHRLGWDVTDFGLGDFEHIGLTLFTIRNGNPDALKTGRGKTYAEKLLITGVNQITPFHFHWTKTEDIINRGGGELRIQLYNSTDNGELADTPIMVSMDGVEYHLDSGAVVTLKPGESITLPTGLYHKFWGEVSTVLVGEVSVVNDDYTDNRFLEPIGRFPEIEEDEEPLYLLVGDYDRFYRP